MCRRVPDTFLKAFINVLASRVLAIFVE